MIEMSPYYAHDSAVGPVFDAATWSPRKVLTMALVAVVAGVAFAAAAVYVYAPGLFADNPPDVLNSLNQEILQAKREYAWGVTAAIGVLGFLALVCLAGGVSMAGDCVRPNYYFRAGVGGLSIRVPQGLDWSKLGLVSKALEIDVPWDQVAQCTFVQHKQFGALSPNAGNLHAHADLKLTDGRKFSFSLDTFREPARIIESKLRDATQMVPARFGLEPSTTVDLSDPSPAQDKPKAIAAALEQIGAAPGGRGAVVLSDAASGKFVQIAVDHGALTVDLPTQSLDEAEQQRAAELFARYGETRKQYELLDRPGGTAVATQSTFQVELGADVAHAVQVSLDVFGEVYRLPSDFRLLVEVLD